MAICRLCRQDRELRNSHIIPEFFYGPCYDDKHRMKVLTLNKEYHKKYRVMPQKGIREELLCDECEQKFSKWERHASQVIFPRIQKQSHSYDDAEVVPGVNYSAFKLFQLSLLWRAGVSSLPEFKLVGLGPHEERIRLMLLNENPGKAYDYGCVITTSRNLPKGFEELVMSPDMIKIHSYKCVRFILNGRFWIFYFKP